jgi:hypothetical protein
MHVEFIRAEDLTQASGYPRLIWKGGKPLIADEIDGVVRLFPLRLVPDCLWRSPILWDCPAPSFSISDEASTSEIFLSRLIELAGRRRIALAELRTVIDLLREALFLIETDSPKPSILGYVADAAESVGQAHAGLAAP